MDCIKILTDIFYPPRCPGCGEIIGVASRIDYYEGRREERAYLHKKCRKNFHRNTCFCHRCGTPMKARADPGDETVDETVDGTVGANGLCDRCADGKRSFEEGRSVFLYEGPAKKALMDIKYHAQSEYCEYFGYAANEYLGEWIRVQNIGVLIPVPVHPKRRKERGYNQAEELAGHLSSFCGIPMRTDVLIRVKNTRALKELSPDERRMSLLDAFGIQNPLPQGACALIVDDIYTTGATMDMCAWKLKLEGGASRVYCLSICAAAGHSAVNRDVPS